MNRYLKIVETKCNNCGTPMKVAEIVENENGICADYDYDLKNFFREEIELARNNGVIIRDTNLSPSGNTISCVCPKCNSSYGSNYIPECFEELNMSAKEKLMIQTILLKENV